MSDATGQLLDGDTVAMWLAMVAASGAGAKKEVAIGAVLRDELGRYWAQEGNATLGSKDSTAHAEMEVLRKASQRRMNHRLPGWQLSVSLAPCAMCQGAMLEARIAKVQYGTAREENKAVPRGEMLIESWSQPENKNYSANLLRKFFESRR